MGTFIRRATATTVLVVLISFAGVHRAFAEDQPQPQLQPHPPQKGEKLDVESVKKKYWATGNESEMNVVQNRMYSKSGRGVVEFFGGTQAGDPFLVSRNVGGLLGYHFNEYIGLNLIGWKTFNSKSSANTAFVETAKLDPNSNEPRSFLGGEVSGSLIYGKLSVLGAAIIYFDLHASIGAGQINTQNGKYFAPMGGFGQQVFLTRDFSLRVDYRVLYFNEVILDKQNGGVPFPDKRTNWTNTLTLGVSWFFL